MYNLVLETVVHRINQYIKWQSYGSLMCLFRNHIVLSSLDHLSLRYSLREMIYIYLIYTYNNDVNIILNNYI